MLQNIIRTLEQGNTIIDTISLASYTDKNIAPFFTSVGAHIRHVLDVFDCVFLGMTTGEIDITKRERNVAVEENPLVAKQYISSAIKELTGLSETDLQKRVFVTDDLGDQLYRAESTLAAVLISANSHALHHYASIRYMLHQLDEKVFDSTIGVNPSTIKNQASA